MIALQRLSSPFSISLCNLSSSSFFCLCNSSSPTPEYLLSFDNHNCSTTEGISSSDEMSSSSFEELILLRLQLSGFTSWFWAGECKTAPDVWCTTWEEKGHSLSPRPRLFESSLSMKSWVKAMRNTRISAGIRDLFRVDQPDT